MHLDYSFQAVFHPLEIHEGLADHIVSNLKHIPRNTGCHTVVGIMPAFKRQFLHRHGEIHIVKLNVQIQFILHPGHIFLLFLIGKRKLLCPGDNFLKLFYGNFIVGAKNKVFIFS